MPETIDVTADSPSNDNHDVVTDVSTASGSRGGRVVGRGGRVSSYHRPAGLPPYNSRERRLANLSEAVARNERELALAKASVAQGRNARLMLLTSRLHQARHELADFEAAGTI